VKQTPSAAQRGEQRVRRAGGERDGNSPRMDKRRVIRSGELFAGDSAELDIEHNGEIYCLRRTSRGKLILTK
jgi:hemin uptake protein HemP